MWYLNNTHKLFLKTISKIDHAYHEICRVPGVWGCMACLPFLRDSAPSACPLLKCTQCPFCPEGFPSAFSHTQAFLSPWRHYTSTSCYYQSKHTFVLVTALTSLLAFLFSTIQRYDSPLLGFKMNSAGSNPYPRKKLPLSCPFCALELKETSLCSL